MERPLKRYLTVLFPFILLAGCSPRLYQPPPLGAEHRLDEGLRPEKKPSHLFDKDMNKYLQQQGIERQEKPSKQAPTPKQSHSTTPQPAPQDSISHQSVAPDTTLRPVAPDSTRHTPSTTLPPAR